MQKELYKLVDSQNLNKNGIDLINQKIDKEIKLRDYVNEQNTKILTLVCFQFIFLGKKFWSLYQGHLRLNGWIQAIYLKAKRIAFWGK